MSEKCELTPICPVYKICSVLSLSEAGKHILNAKREILLALKAVIEKEVARIDRTGEENRAKKVKIK